MRQTLGLALLLAGAGFLASGCGGGGTTVGFPSPNATASVSVATAAPSAQASASPAPGASSIAGGSTATPTASPKPSAAASPQANGAPEVARSILPSTTDIMANDPDLPHYEVNPDPKVAPKNQLFVFLPGTGAIPLEYTDILTEAAARGYHAVGIEYPNVEKVDYICDFMSADCYGDVHLEVLTGQDANLTEVVTPSNSIEHRLIALVQYLAATYPAEGWGQYVTSSGDMVWSSLVVSGHSQGSGHAAYLAKELENVARLCLFSGPDDWNSTNGTATYALDGKHVTPASRYHGFINTADTVEPTTEVFPVWAAFGMGATQVSVDSATPPYGGSQELMTSHAPADAGDPIGAHDEPVVDLSTPSTNGVPLHVPVWDNNCFQ